MTKSKRRARMTATACLSALIVWLRESLGLETRSAQLLERDGMLWVELTGLHDPTASGQDEYAYARGVLWPRPVADYETSLTSDVLLVALHVNNPTPQVEDGSGYTRVSTPLTWQTVALVPTPDGIEGRDVTWFRGRWGETAAWPFSES